MAEQALVADLRIGLDKFNADLQKAQSAADRATANIRKSVENVGSGAGPAANEIQKVNTKLDETAKSANNAAQAVGNKLNPALQTMKGVIGALGIDVGARALVQFATSAIKAAESITGVERQLTQLRGSSTAAAAEMAFIRAETIGWLSVTLMAQKHMCVWLTLPKAQNSMAKRLNLFFRRLARRCAPLV